MKWIEGGSEGEEWRRRGKGGGRRGRGEGGGGREEGEGGRGEGEGPEERVEEGAKEQYVDLPVSLSGLEAPYICSCTQFDATVQIMKSLSGWLGYTCVFLTTLVFEIVLCQN